MWKIIVVIPTTLFHSKHYLLNGFYKHYPLLTETNDSLTTLEENSFVLMTSTFTGPVKCLEKMHAFCETQFPKESAVAFMYDP